MTDQDGSEEIVALFDSDGTAVVSEYRFADFESFTAREETLDQFAASVVQAVYAIVSSGLVVRGLVFFVFKVDEDGYVNSGFNLPLKYLAENAGAGPDLGHGPVRLACRGQCPVPWHASSLWEPQGEGDASPAMLVQKSVWRNRLEIRPMGNVQGAVGELINGDNGVREQELEEVLTETFGEEGKVGLEQFMRQHNDQLLDAKQRFRDDLQQQQQNYLDQIHGLKDDLQELKVALRHEQDRNRRLQELLRGG